MMQIVEVNRCIETGLSGLLAKNVAEWWDGLQTECAQYINSDLPGMPSTLQTQGKRLRGFVQRLKGKSGRFRGNLSGEEVVVVVVDGGVTDVAVTGVVVTGVGVR